MQSWCVLARQTHSGAVPGSYGVVGPWGCGGTVLLDCIVGTVELFCFSAVVLLQLGIVLRLLPCLSLLQHLVLRREKRRKRELNSERERESFLINNRRFCISVSTLVRESSSTSVLVHKGR